MHTGRGGKQGHEVRREIEGGKDEKGKCRRERERAGKGKGRKEGVGKRGVEGDILTVLLNSVCCEEFTEYWKEGEGGRKEGRRGRTDGREG